MTKQEINKVCAELDGIYKCTNPDFKSDILFHHKGVGFLLEKDIPKYTTSRDAIIPAVIKWCNEYGWERFTSELITITEYKSHQFEQSPSFVVQMTCRATPLQLSTAWIKAAGKWSETKITHTIYEANNGVMKK